MAIAQPLWTFFYIAGHTSDWITTFECAAAAVEGHGDDTVKYYLLNALGSAYVRAGRYQQAIDVHQECVAAREAMDDLIGASRSRSNLAMSYERLGRYEEALSELTAALHVYQQKGERGLECLLLGTNIPNVLNKMGRHQEALDHLIPALALVREIGTPLSIARTEHTLGDTYVLMSQPKTALEHLAEALQVARQVGDRRLEALTVGTIGQAQLALGNLTTALALVHQAYEAWCQMGIRANECQDLTVIGDIYTALAQPGKARAAYERALEIADELGLSQTRAEAMVGLGRLSVEHDRSQARQYLGAALAILDPIAPAKAKETRELLATLSEEAAVGGPAG